jgi:hypothetical protein
VGLLVAALQVVVSQAGKVTFYTTNLLCPSASNFQDLIGGMYGAQAHSAHSTFCNSGKESETEVLASSLSFACVLCPYGFYSMFAGSSNGSVGNTIDFPCLACPNGGVCANGAVTATPGRWGAANSTGSVAFAVCPAGYCDAADVPTLTDVRLKQSVVMNNCSGHRSGPLCGDCAGAFVEAVGSARCALLSTCDTQATTVWLFGAGAVLLSAVLQLTMVSGVWLASPRAPNNKMKLALYFFQVGASLLQ